MSAFPAGAWLAVACARGRSVPTDCVEPEREPEPGSSRAFAAFAGAFARVRSLRALPIGLGLALGLGLATTSAAAQTTHLLIISGIGGEPAYADTFYHESAALVDAARARLALPDSNVVLLGENPARDPKRIRARSTLENVARAIDELARRTTTGDRVLLVLIGHGSDADGTPMLNLPGPDLSAAALSHMLDKLDGRDVAVVNTTSASGGFVAGLAHKGRIVVTATHSAGESNETIFARYFVEALTSGAADTDKDGTVSLLEAFEYARREVARAYQAERQLQTEHAQLDGDGDGVATMAPDSSGGDRIPAAAFVLNAQATPGPLAAGAAPAMPADSATRALLAKRRELQQKIATLEGRKAGMDPAAYEAALDPLLLELARTDAAIRAAGAKGARAP